MRTGWLWGKLGGAVILSVAVLCMGNVNFAQAATPQHPKKRSAKKPELPPLPSGPTGPVQQVPLDAIAAVPPQVTFQNDELTIVAPNSTLGDILRAVRKQTGAEIEIPSAPDRVVTHLGPGPARDVVAELLNGSRFNYILLGSPNNDSQLAKVVLVAKSGVETNAAAPPVNAQANNATPPPGQEANAEPMGEPEQNDENNANDDAADQAAAEAEQQQQQQLLGNQQNGNNPDQPAVKTPQQMLQEMQQRQMQLQQQQVPGQPPTPGSGMPPHPPQEQ